jgi:hypothetical protein
MYECRKRVDSMELTGSPTEEDLSRVALALINGVLQIGNKELVYSIVSTPGYNVGKAFEYQDQYDFLVKHTTVLEAGITPGPPSHHNSMNAAAQPTASLGASSDAEAADAGFYPSSIERPLGTKASKRRKRGVDTSVQSEVASSVRDLTESMHASDAVHARNQSEKLRLYQESNRLRMYETLYLHESSTASQAERELAGAKMRRFFLESLGNRPGRADGAPTVPSSESPTHAQPQLGQASDYVVEPREHECTLGETEGEGPTNSQRIQGEYVDVPHVHGLTELTENNNDNSETNS